MIYRTTVKSVACYAASAFADHLQDRKSLQEVFVRDCRSYAPLYSCDAMGSFVQRGVKLSLSWQWMMRLLGQH